MTCIRIEDIVHITTRLKVHEKINIFLMHHACYTGYRQRVQNLCYPVILLYRYLFNTIIGPLTSSRRPAACGECWGEPGGEAEPGDGGWLTAVLRPCTASRRATSPLPSTWPESRHSG